MLKSEIPRHNRLPLCVSVFTIHNVGTLDKFWKSDSGEVELCQRLVVLELVGYHRVCLPFVLLCLIPASPEEE